MSTPNVGAPSVIPDAQEQHPVEYRRVYVWQLPVRVYHWINAVAMVGLCVTGYLIGAPFGTVRFIHFTCAFVWMFNFAARIYWGFVGNEYARWNNFFPLTKKQRQEIVDVVKADVLQVKLHGPISLGHNSLAATIYFLTFLAFLVQVVTGFALYSSMSNSWLPRMFIWIVPLLGGEFAVRFWHHLFLWFFVCFIVVHIYLSFYHDYIEGRGTVSSIIGGWKFDREKRDK
jgi:Ni/Fe-hydrogenase 1 B-type cytochrome subunit